MAYMKISLSRVQQIVFDLLFQKTALTYFKKYFIDVVRLYKSYCY